MLSRSAVSSRLLLYAERVVGDHSSRFTTRGNFLVFLSSPRQFNLRGQLLSLVTVSPH